MIKKRKYKDFWFWLLVSWAVIFILWLTTPWLVQIGLRFNELIKLYPEKDTGLSEGTFGDQYGAINALFSGLALASIAISLWYQRQDIENQREDIKIQQQALIDQKGMLDKQLRFAATTEIVASLPVVNLKHTAKKVEVRIAPSPHTAPGNLEISNTGTEVYDLKIWLLKRDEPELCVNVPVWKTDQAHSFDISIDFNNLDEIRLRVYFVIRSGESVALNYNWDIRTGTYRPVKTWREVIQEILNDKMQSLDNRE